MTDFQPDDAARILAAQLFDRLSLNADGQPFDDSDPATWEMADAVEPEVVRLGVTRFKIVDAEAVDLAAVAGAIEPGAAPKLCMRVAFEEADGAPEPSTGRYIALETDVPNVSILFLIWLTHADLHDPAAPNLGPDAMRNEALDVLELGQALLVQVFDSEAGAA